MLVKQISVFVENQPGKLVRLTRALAENGIGEDIISALDLSSAEDEEAALRWAKKHGLGVTSRKRANTKCHLTRFATLTVAK